MATWTVEAGDSLWDISVRSLGMQLPGQSITTQQVAGELQRIVSINRAKLNNTPDLIHRGLVLDLGGAPTPTEAARMGKEQRDNAEGKGAPPASSPSPTPTKAARMSKVQRDNAGDKGASPASPPSPVRTWQPARTSDGRVIIPRWGWNYYQGRDAPPENMVDRPPGGPRYPSMTSQPDKYMPENGYYFSYRDLMSNIGPGRGNFGEYTRKNWGERAPSTKPVNIQHELPNWFKEQREKAAARSPQSQGG